MCILLERIKRDVILLCRRWPDIPVVTHLSKMAYGSAPRYSSDICKLYSSYEYGSEEAEALGRV